MSSFCHIHLNYPQRVFTPGDLIEGKVKCFFRNNKDTRGITLNIKGEEHTAWNEQAESYFDENNQMTRYKIINYSGDNKFIYHQINLFNGTTLYSGHHEYQFSYRLPNNIPSTFKNRHGYIRYSIKATIEIPWKRDYEANVSFSVDSPIDFKNMSIDLQTPIQWSNEKFLSCCCWTSGPITFDLHLRKAAFVLGETINPRVECTNMTNTNVTAVEIKVKMALVTKVERPTTKTQKETELVVSKVSRGVGAHGQRKYDLHLKIPPNLLVYNFNKSKLFSQYFYIEATCQIHGCHSDIELRGGIQLGHIPYAPLPAITSTTASIPHEPISLVDSVASDGSELPSHMPLTHLLLPYMPSPADLGASTSASPDSQIDPPTYDQAIKSLLM